MYEEAPCEKFGFRAGLSGEPITDNPYTGNTVARQAWDRGWHKGAGRHSYSLTELEDIEARDRKWVESMTVKPATETMDAMHSMSAANTDARIVHDAMERFSYHWAPSEPRKQAEFQADLLMLIQAVHRDAARPFGDMLTKAMAAMPPMIFPQSK